MPETLVSPEAGLEIANTQAPERHTKIAYIMSRFSEADGNIRDLRNTGD